MATSTDSVELRGQAPRLTTDVLDAMSMRRRMTRWDLVLEILNQWADERMQDATVVMRVARANEDGGGK